MTTRAACVCSVRLLWPLVGFHQKLCACSLPKHNVEPESKVSIVLTTGSAFSCQELRAMPALRTRRLARSAREAQ